MIQKNSVNKEKKERFNFRAKRISRYKLTIHDVSSFIKKQTVMIDDEAWEKSGPILRDAGFSRSAFLSACLKIVCRLDKESIEDLTEKMALDVLNMGINESDKK